MKVKSMILAATAILALASNPASAHDDRDGQIAAGIALGAAAIIAGAIVSSQRRNHHHHYVAPPVYAPPPPPLRYRYYEPVPAPSPYYHHPYRRHWN